jgi:hypothetical protein
LERRNIKKNKQFLSENIDDLSGSSYQRQFAYKFDIQFFSFLFDSNKIFNRQDSPNNSQENISIFAIHVYASILNESLLNNSNQTSATNILAQQNDNLLRAITPHLIEFLIDFFNEKDENTLSKERNVSFYDKKLIFCRCLPLIVNVLHSSLPDKRLVDLGNVLDRFMDAFQKCKRNDIKLEFVRSYLSMLHECTDRAALKIVIVSKRFFISLIEQLKFVFSNVKFDEISDLANESKKFLHEFLRLVLCLIKSLLENSDSVKVNKP